MANDDVWRRDEIESPCVKICMIHPETRLCTGCLRSPMEISMWSRMDGQERREIMAQLPERREKFGLKRRGGRAARLQRGPRD